MCQTWCTCSSIVNDQLLRSRITSQICCNYSIRINQWPHPSIYHLSNLPTDAQSDQSVNSSVYYSRVKPSSLFNLNQSITSSLHLSRVKLFAKVSIRLYQSTLPSVNHASNLVQFFNPNQSITSSSLYLSCVKVGSGPNGSLGRIIYHFFPVLLSLNQDSPHKIFMWAVPFLFYT